MANKFINELNTIESVAVGDELPIWDSSESDTRKTTISKLSSALTVNLVSEGISAPPSSNAVAVAVKNANAVLHVETLPTSPDIKNVIYHNTTDGKYYVGNKTTQTTSELNTDSVRYVQVLPVSPNIENLIYAVESLSGKYKFYAGDKENQTTQELGGSGAIFTGTQAEWDALTTAEKNEYSQANITDSNSTVFVPVDTVADGNMNPVTSNAVYDKLISYTTGTATANSSIVTGSATWQRIGSVVIVELKDIILNGYGSNRTMFSNLPTAIDRVDTVISNGSVHVDIGISTNSGVISTKYNNTNTGSNAMNGSLVYFTAN